MATSSSTPPTPDPVRSPAVERAEYRGEALAARGVFGGFLMGLANLVPGISGGTMLLAAGVYPQVIGGIAEVTTFRFRARTIVLLACVIGAAIVAIAGFAGLVGELVIHHRPIMYALFIGLTLGGVPILWRMLRPADPAVVVASIVGIAIMAAIVAFDPGSSSAAGGGTNRQYGMLLLAGIAGGSAMILPGVSGGYLLLVLGQYVVILTTIDSAKDAVRASDWAAAAQTLHVIVPVGIGVVTGVVGVSNLLRILLAKYERATLGVLLGLLLGAVIGLWPFQASVPPAVGDTIKGIVLETQAMVDAVEPKDWSAEPFAPTVLQVATVLAVMAGGFLVSMGIDRLGNPRKP